MSVIESPITIRQLELFSAAAKAGSFVAASEEMLVTPNAVSSSVSELEKVIGTLLFRRIRAKGLELTPAGNQLRERVEQILQATQQMLLDVRDDEEFIRGPVKVGVYSTLAPTIVPRLWEYIRQSYPAIDLEIFEGESDYLSRRLIGGEFDLVIAFEVGIASQAKSQTLYEVGPEILLPVTHPMARLDSVVLKDLADEPMVLLDLPPSGENTLRLMASQGIHPRVVHRSGSADTVRSMVARGAGYSLMFSHPANDVSYDGVSLVRKPIRPNIAPEPVVVGYMPYPELTYRAQAVLDVVSELKFTV